MIWRVMMIQAVLVAGATPATADPGRDLVTVRQSMGEPGRVRDAWARLTACGPEALLPILHAWPADDPALADRFAALFVRIAAADRDRLPLDGLIDVATDPTRPARVRALAVWAVEMARPGTGRQVSREPDPGPEVRQRPGLTPPAAGGTTRPPGPRSRPA